MYLKIDGFNVS